MTEQYRTVTLDGGIRVPTTEAGAQAIERLQTQLRDARSEIDGLSGQLAALRSIRDEAASGTAADARQAARDAHAGMTTRLSDGWKHGRAA